MAVLLSYHRLIEKDSKHVSYCWKWSILVVLAVTVASSLIISFSLYSLWESFSLNCFMGANLSFATSKSSGLREMLQKNRTEKERQILLKLLQPATLDEKYIISEYDSKWSNPDYCEYLTYTPLFHALLGVIWAAIFVTHGHGGEGVGSIIARPWRIVIPSLIFFIVCGISATVCASLMSNSLENFCKQFDQIYSTAKIDCARMISYFSMTEANDLVLPDKNYYLVAVFPWIWASSYICGIVILLLRIMLVVDFKLIRIVISTIEMEKESEENDQSNVKVLNEATQVAVEDLVT